MVLLFIIKKWTEPSVEASGKSREEIQMRKEQFSPAQRSIGFSPFAITAISSFGLLPFIVISLLFMRPKTVLITDSIPDHRVLVTSIMILWCMLIAYPNRRMFDQKFYGGGPAAFFIAVSLINIACSDWYYRSAYEEYLFSGKITSYSRVAFINHLSIVDNRGGRNFFGHVNPNNISTIDPKIDITRDLYNHLTRTDNDGAVVPKGFPTCSVSLSVERSGNAERIVIRSLVDTPDVVECQRPI